METTAYDATSSVADSLANAGGCQAGAAQLAPLEAEVQASPERVALSRSLLPPPPHVQQDFNWDCGLACVLMVLRGLGAPERCNMDTMRHLCPEQSVWTVDLAHLLHRCGLAVTFCTLTLGANPDYAEEAFYRGCLAADVERVNSLFAQAAELGISVQRRSVSLGELRALVSTGQHVAILLVDKHKVPDCTG
jgi:Guanylylate cyclase